MPASGDTVDKVVVETSEEAAQKWLQTAKSEEILASDSSHKSLFVLLRNDASDEQGVLLLNKSPFPENKEQLASLISSMQLRELAKNDIYGNYEANVDPKFNALKTTLIYPANEKIIAKYRSEEKIVFEETPEDYQTITVPYIEQYQMNLKWVYNVLERRAEAERIILEDSDKHNGFILAPDLKWDGKTAENLYVLAIIHRHGVKSIRDLTGDDLPMLEGLREKCLVEIRERYGVATNQIKAYFHYQPSFYHLHVHFVHMSYDAPGSTSMSAVLLNDVINNLRVLPEFYKKSTLSFARKRSDKLAELFEQARAK